jgi:hypothetical protein
MRSQTYGDKQREAQRKKNEELKAKLRSQASETPETPETDANSKKQSEKKTPPRRP